MALLFMDGFEHYASGDAGEKWTWTASANVSSTYARTGTYSAMGNFVIAPSPADATCIVGCGVRSNTTGWVLTVNGNNGYNSDVYAQCSIVVNGSGALVAYRGYANGTVIGTSAAGVFKFGIWNYIELKALIDDAAGTVTVKVNGATVLTLTGQDTKNLSASGWTSVEFYSQSVAYWDDIYVCDASGAQNNDLLGECRVVTLLPSDGNGSNTDFTCSSSTDHGALVNEAAPNDDTDYVYSSTVNHVDSWNYPALGYTGTIKGVQMSLSAKKTDSGTRAIAAVTRPASTNRVHATNRYLGTSYAYWMSIWELNPEDSAAWEVADVDGAEFGVKVTV